MRLIYHPEAREELKAAATFYANRLPGLGSDFLDEFERSVTYILEAPARFRCMDRDVRIYSLKRFPYAIYFRVEAQVVRILAIKHHRQHPDYWKHRR